MQKRRKRILQVPIQVMRAIQASQVLRVIQVLQAHAIRVLQARHALQQVEAHVILHLGARMSKEIELFGKKVVLGNNICSKDDTYKEDKYRTYNLYISIIDVCLASCPFCNNNTKKKQTFTDKKFDVEKLKQILKELKDKSLLNRVSITGGEPFLNIELLNEVINSVFEMCGDNQYLTINTNGFNLDRVTELDKIKNIAGIHISRHHYLDEKNDNLFGFKTIHLEEIKHLQDKLENKHLLRLNSLLIKNYIDSAKEVENYLEMAAKLGIFRVGFVGLMPLNEFSKQNYVEYHDILNNLSQDCAVVSKLKNSNTCDCANGMYMSKEGKLVEFYSRVVRDLNPQYAGQLSYTVENNLCAGFGNIIY